MSTPKPYIVTPQTVAANMNIVLYGDPGSGKTVLSCSAQDAPTMKDVLVANVEGGLISVASRGDIQAVDIVGVLKPDQIPEGREEHEITLEELAWALAKGDKRFKTIRTLIVDSATELQSLNLDEIVQKSIQGGKKGRDRDQLWQEDYGKSTNQLKRLFRMFRDLPLNVIWTAHAKPLFPPGAKENAQPVGMMPSLTSKLGTSLMGYVDFVWFLYTEEDAEGIIHRKLLTQTVNGYQAKTRGLKFADALGTTVEDPTLAELFDLFIKSEEVK